MNDTFRRRLLEIARHEPDDNHLRVLAGCAAERARELSPSDSVTAELLHEMAIAASVALAERRAMRHRFEDIMCAGMGVRVFPDPAN